MRKIVIILAMFVASGVAYAQNSDLGVLVGTTYTGSSLRFGTQVNYAWQFWERPVGRLYLELPVIIPAADKDSPISLRLFVTPGIRYHFNVTPRAVLYAAAGGGLGYIPGSSRTSGAFAFGGGVDFRLTRLWSVRGDLRNITTTSKVLDSGRNSPSVMVGVAMHF